MRVTQREVECLEATINEFNDRQLCGLMLTNPVPLDSERPSQSIRGLAILRERK